VSFVVLLTRTSVNDPLRRVVLDSGEIREGVEHQVQKPLASTAVCGET
jgi:hypothetical protein